MKALKLFTATVVLLVASISYAAPLDFQPAFDVENTIAASLLDYAETDFIAPEVTPASVLVAAERASPRVKSAGQLHPAAYRLSLRATFDSGGHIACQSYMRQPRYTVAAYRPFIDPG